MTEMPESLSLIGRPRSRASIWIAAIRPRTLFAAASPVLVGTALAAFDSAVHVISAVCALASALMIQIGTNLFNDYSDAVKGADTTERIGPLRVTQAGLLAPSSVLKATVLSFALAVAFGTYLMIRGGLPIIIVGVCSIVFGFVYSGGRFSLSSLGIADLFVLIFFGPVAVGGTYYVQSLSLSPPVIVAGFAPGVLATAILVVNNVRDIQQDRRAGRGTLVVRFGRRFGVFLYAFCLTAGSLVPVVLVMIYGYPAWVLVASAIIVPAFPMVDRLASNEDGPILNGLLATTGIVLFLFSVLFSVGLIIG